MEFIVNNDVNMVGAGNGGFTVRIAVSTLPLPLPTLPLNSGSARCGCNEETWGG